MNYPLKSKPKYPNRFPIISIVVLFILLSFSAFLFSNTFRSALFGISRPLWSLRHSVSKSFVSVKNFFILKSILVSENLFLQDELADLKLKQFDYDILLQENQNLKNELGRSGKSHRVISAILSKPPFSPYDTFVIDAGSSDGVVVGSRAYISESIIVGLVKEATAHTSLIQLFSSGNQKQQATLSRTGASFTLEGSGGANFKLEVPKEADILLGDVFLYPSLSSSVIGTVYYIDTNSQSAFKTVHLRIPQNIFQSRYIWVEKNP